MDFTRAVIQIAGLAVFVYQDFVQTGAHTGRPIPHVLSHPEGIRQVDLWEIRVVPEKGRSEATRYWVARIELGVMRGV